MKIGDRVFHPKFGWGVIKLIFPTPQKLCARVDFDYARDNFPLEELLDSPGGSPIKEAFVPEGFG